MKKKNKLCGVGDIVVFEEEGSLITHRIIRIDEDNNIVTRGDANNTEDEPMKRDDVIAEVTKTINNIAIWEKVFASPEVYISIIVTVTLFGIAFAYKGKENEKEEK